MSVKPCSSNSEHSHSADSASASGVALPYLVMIRLSREPALTPILIGMPASDAARAISPTLSSNALMLPGLPRTAARPAVVLGRDRDADDLAPRGGEFRDLLQGRVPVGGHGRGHRLDGDGGTATDGHRMFALTHHDLARLAPRGQRLRRHFGQSKINSH